MRPPHGPRRRGTLRLVTAAVVAALVVGGAVGYGVDVWGRVTEAGDHPAASAPHGDAAPGTTGRSHPGRGGQGGHGGEPGGHGAADDGSGAATTGPRSSRSASSPPSGAAARSTSALRLGGPAPSLPPDPTPADIAAAANPSIVTIWTDIPSNSAGLRVRGAGTGIVLTDDGVVLTNNHVITGADRITATHVATGEDYRAHVLGYDRSHDVAVLRLDGAGDLPPAALGDARDLRIGQPVVAIGNAGGTGALITSPGTVTAFDQAISAQDPDGTSERLDGVLQIAADINPGDSGGPLLDMRGRVVGMDTAKSESAQPDGTGAQVAKGYAIPIGDALRVARTVLGEGDGNASTVHIGATALLGVHVRTKEAEPPRGAEILDVIADSPAQEAGLQAGDVITAVGGRRIESADALSTVIDAHAPGDVLDVHWVRADGELTDAPIILAEGLPR